MSEAARAHMNHTADALKGHGASISPAEKALIYPGLAQAEATIVLRRKGPVDTCEYEASERPGDADRGGIGQAGQLNSHPQVLR